MTHWLSPSNLRATSAEISRRRFQVSPQKSYLKLNLCFDKYWILTGQEWLEGDSDGFGLSNGGGHVVQELSLGVRGVEVGGLAGVDDRSAADGKEGVEVVLLRKVGAVDEAGKWTKIRG